MFPIMFMYRSVPIDRFLHVVVGGGCVPDHVHVCSCMFMYVRVCSCMFMYVHVCSRELPWTMERQKSAVVFMRTMRTENDVEL